MIFARAQSPHQLSEPVCCRFAPASSSKYICVCDVCFYLNCNILSVLYIRDTLNIFDVRQ